MARLLGSFAVHRVVGALAFLGWRLDRPGRALLCFGAADHSARFDLFFGGFNEVGLLDRLGVLFVILIRMLRFVGWNFGLAGGSTLDTEPGTLGFSSRSRSSGFLRDRGRGRCLGLTSRRVKRRGKISLSGDSPISRELVGDSLCCDLIIVFCESRVCEFVIYSYW